MADKYSIEDGVVYLDEGWPVSWEKPEGTIVQIQLNRLAELVKMCRESEVGVSLAKTYDLASGRQIDNFVFPDEYTQEEVWATGRYLASWLWHDKTTVPFLTQIDEAVAQLK
jgi:hypothetical protein